jgi:HPt (histidine-containing phosphotransfer) domain-containing protein
MHRLLIRWGLLEEDKTAAPPEPVSAPAAAAPVKSADGLPPAVDIEKLKEQMGAFDDGTIQMMHMFADMTAPIVADLKTARDNHDFHALKELGHSLKGSARSACCNVLGDIAAQLQTDAADKKPGCEALVDSIAVEFERVKLHIRELKA